MRGSARRRRRTATRRQIAGIGRRNKMTVRSDRAEGARMRRAAARIGRGVSGIGCGAGGRREAGHRVALGLHALPIHDVVLLLQRSWAKGAPPALPMMPRAPPEAAPIAAPFAGVACSRADTGTKPRSERCTQ